MCLESIHTQDITINIPPPPPATPITPFPSSTLPALSASPILLPTPQPHHTAKPSKCNFSFSFKRVFTASSLLSPSRSHQWSNKWFTLLYDDCPTPFDTRSTYSKYFMRLGKSRFQKGGGGGGGWGGGGWILHRSPAVCLNVPVQNPTQSSLLFFLSDFLSLFVSLFFFFFFFFFSFFLFFIFFFFFSFFSSSSSFFLSSASFRTPHSLSISASFCLPVFVFFSFFLSFILVVVVDDLFV